MVKSLVVSKRRYHSWPLKPLEELDGLLLFAGFLGKDVLEDCLSKSSFETDFDYFWASDGKTGALLAHSFLLGIEAAAGDAAAWEPWALVIGRLFQATDDLLDATRSTEELGKTAGKDDAVEKATLVAVLGLEGAQRYAEALAAQAQSLLAGLPAERHQVELAGLPAYLLERCR